MREFLACIACLLLFVVVVDAAWKEFAGNIADKVMPLRRQLVRGSKGHGINIIENQRRKHMHQILNANSRYDFQLVLAEKTVQGNTKRRLQVTFDGLPVLGVNVQASYDTNKGYIGGLTGEMVSGIEDDIPDSSACPRKNDDLFSLGKRTFGIPDDCEYCKLENVTKAVRLDADDTAHLVYTIAIGNKDPKKPTRPFLVVDACDLSVIEKFNRNHNYRSHLKRAIFGDDSDSRPVPNQQPVSHRYKRQACNTAARGLGGNPKTQTIRYGTPPYCLDVWVSGGMCVLDNPGVRVIDLDQTTSAAGRSPYQYNCFRTDDAINGGRSANLDAFFFGTVMTTIFQNQYGINQPLGTKMTIHTHYSSGYENAFWDGSAVNFGDGSSYFYPLVSLDILAHEVAHGVTDRYSNLYYSAQSGGINEAFSDITGEAIESLAAFRSNDWYVAYDIVKRANSALRFFRDPTRDGRSIAHISNYYNGLNVHYSSGIYNKAFYEMVVTQRIPIRDAYFCFLRANQIYWTVNTGFVQGACDVQSAAVDLGINTNKIRAAFAVVGIDSNSCGGNAMDTLDPGYIRIYVSRNTNPCFLLLPRNADWYYVYIYTSNSRRTNVAITIYNGVTGRSIGTRYNRLGYYLPTSGQDRVVCFRSSFPTMVTVNTYYCGRNHCYH